MEATERRLTGRVGGLGTGPEGYDGALFVRQVELCRQALAYGRDGTLAGGFLGSEVNNRPEVWMRDCFYAALPLAWFAPEICADAASFFTANGRPGKAWGRGVGRFEPHAGPAHSIGNAVAAIVLAGAYLRATGDVEWLRRRPQPYEYGVSLFDSLGRLRGPDVLFPSLYVSDGDARGDWHTGSNILVWRALMDMADMAGHALGDGAAAEHWRAEATTLHAAIVDRCAGPGPEGMQFYEGAFRDGSFVAGHDGEESDLTLASHYGFTAAHDPLVLTHSRLAFCAENPLYWPPLDGVQWWDSEVCFGPTFPAYIHRLAGAQSEEDVESDLSQLRTLADVDGSFWWWPYRPFATDTSHIARGIAKSSWAAGVFVCRMVSDVLGVRANALTRRLSVRPFCPWSYHWPGARLGAIAFDVEYTMSDSGRHLAVRNNSDKELRLDLEVVGPGPQMPRRVVVDGRGQPETWAVGWRFGRRTVSAGAVLAAGQQFELRCSWGGRG